METCEVLDFNKVWQGQLQYCLCTSHKN